jgi:hypothetical protein
VERTGQRPSSAGAPSRAGRPYLGLALIALAVGCGFPASAGAQTDCTRDGDWLACDDGRHYAIRLDPDAGGRLGRWPPGSPVPRDRTDGTRVMPGTDAAPLRTQDGLACWPHGDHVHCR